MKAETLYQAIGEIRDDFIQEAETDQVRTRKNYLKPLLVACVTILLLAVPVSAEVTTGYVSNLLAPLYGGAQTELVDSIGIPVEAFATVGDYTLTADAVIGDRYNIAIVYTLTRNDGAPMAEGTCFDAFSGWKLNGSGGGYLQQELSEDGTELRIIEQWTGTNRQFWIKRNASIEFRDLVLYQGEGKEDILLAEGTWKLDFTVRYRDTTVEIPVDDLQVTGDEGNWYQIHEILISPIGIHMEMTIANPHLEGFVNEPFMTDFAVSVVLKDGTEIELKDANRGMTGSRDDTTLDADYGTMFEEPIPLEEIAALVICDTTFPVELGA